MDKSSQCLKLGTMRRMATLEQSHSTIIQSNKKTMIWAMHKNKKARAQVIRKSEHRWYQRPFSKTCRSLRKFLKIGQCPLSSQKATQTSRARATSRQMTKEGVKCSRPPPTSMRKRKPTPSSSRPPNQTEHSSGIFTIIFKLVILNELISFYRN